MNTRTEKLTPLRAIRLYCRECSSGTKGVRLCPITDCELFSFRMGHGPKRSTQSEPALTERKRAFATTARLAKQEKRRSGSTQNGTCLLELILK